MILCCAGGRKEHAIRGTTGLLACGLAAGLVGLLLALQACWLAGLAAGLVGLLLALQACWLAGLAGACWACWLAGLRALLASFLFFSFAGCLLPALSTSSRLPRELAFFSFLFFCFALVWFLFVSFQHYLPFSSCSFYVQIFICTLKHNIKFRLNKINITHIK
jgi:hypothetical protein